jgi:hypothetical protein
MRKRIISVVLAALLLTVGVDMASYAAGGKSLLLGHKNTAKKTTKLKNSGNGPALALKNKAAFPPLSVSSSTKVTKLNADLLDGIDSAALKSVGYRYSLPATSGLSSFSIRLPGLPPGIYDAKFAVIAQLGAIGDHVSCFFRVGGGGDAQALAYGGTFANYSSSTGGTILDVRSTAPILECFGDSAMTVDPPGGKSSISFTRLDSVNSGASIPARKSTLPARKSVGSPTG